MRALLLAAGFGTRLRPLTDTLPKCLVSINGEPLLSKWLNSLNAAGFTEILINTHYLSDLVDDFVAANPMREKIITSYEPKLLGTAGTLRRHRDFFLETGGILLHADNYCLADLEEFLKKHSQRPKQCVMTMMTFETDDPQSCGIVEIDEAGVVTEFYEKVLNPPSCRANGAIYILAPSFFDAVNLDDKNFYDISRDIIPTLIGKIFTHHVAEPLMDIGTMRKLKDAQFSSPDT